MRNLAPRMSLALGQPILVDNKSEGGELAGIAEVAHSAPDGYTLLFGFDSTVVSPYLYKNAGFDPVRDFQPVSEVLAVPIVILASSTLPVTSLKELAAYSRVHPGKLSAGSVGAGSVTHLCLEMYKWISGADISPVPYKDVESALAALLVDRSQVLAVSAPLSAPFVHTDMVKALAVAGAHRASNMPDVPTTAEAGFPGLQFSTWMGLLGPAGLPPLIVERVRDAALQALKDPDNVKRFTEAGVDILGTTPAEFGQFISAESAKFGRAVEMARIKPE